MYGNKKITMRRETHFLMSCYFPMMHLTKFMHKRRDYSLLWGWKLNANVGGKFLDVLLVPIIRDIVLYRRGELKWEGKGSFFLFCYFPLMFWVFISDSVIRGGGGWMNIRMERGNLPMFTYFTLMFLARMCESALRGSWKLIYGGRQD